MSQFRARPPAVPTVLLDDAVCRITRWDFEPGADTGHHVHGLGYVVVPMTDCRFLLEERAAAGGSISPRAPPTGARRASSTMSLMPAPSRCPLSKSNTSNHEHA